MSTAEVMRDGMLKLPQEITDLLHLKPGDTMGLDVGDDGSIRLYRRGLKPADVCGMLGARTKVTATIEQMDQGVADAFSRGEL